MNSIVPTSSLCLLIVSESKTKSAFVDIQCGMKRYIYTEKSKHQAAPIGNVQLATNVCNNLASQCRNSSISSYWIEVKSNVSENIVFTDDEVSAIQEYFINKCFCRLEVDDSSKNSLNSLAAKVEAYRLVKMCATSNNTTFLSRYIPIDIWSTMSKNEFEDSKLTCGPTYLNDLNNRNKYDEYFKTFINTTVPIYIAHILNMIEVIYNENGQTCINDVYTNSTPLSLWINSLLMLVNMHNEDSVKYTDKFKSLIMGHNFTMDADPVMCKMMFGKKATIVQVADNYIEVAVDMFNYIVLTIDSEDRLNIGLDYIKLLYVGITCIGVRTRLNRDIDTFKFVPDKYFGSLTTLKSGSAYVTTCYTLLHNLFNSIYNNDSSESINVGVGILKSSSLIA